MATLPLVLVVILLELAVGGAFVVWFLDRGGQAPAGFLRLAGVVDAAAMGGAVLLIPTLPKADALDKLGLETWPIGWLAALIPTLAVVVIFQFLATFLPSGLARSVLGLVTLAAGVAVLTLAAFIRPPVTPYDRVFDLIALPLGALALGGSEGAMLLGHWYLVTPKLSPAPLRRAALVVVGAVALQLLLVVISLALGELSGTFETALVVAIAIRIGVGILMTLGIAVAAWWTARLNTQSSTGLLYVGLGTVLAGEISARVLFFLTGVAI